MIEDLRRLLTGPGSDLGLPALASGGTLIAADRDPRAKAIVVLLDRRGRAVAVAKTSRTRRGERALRAEHTALSGVWEAAGPAIRGSIPRPLALTQAGGRLVMVVTALPGRPMATRYYRPGHVSSTRAVARDFEMAAAWLEGFHRETRAGSEVVGAGTFDRWVEPVLDRYRSSVGWSAAEDRVFRDVRRRLADLDGLVMPLTAVHGDFGFGNLLVAGSRIRGVVDWEFGATVGPPFRDIYKFPTSYGLYLGHGSNHGRPRGHPGMGQLGERWGRLGTRPNLSGVAYAFFGRGWFPSLIRDFVRRRLGALDIPPAANAVFFPVFLAGQAVAQDNRDYRNAYRTLLRAFGQEASATWLWGRVA